MRYLSVCSGIEAATVAWEPLGWEPLAFAEIEPFPSAVLAHHWPEVPNLGDFTTIMPDDLPAKPDLLVGGTPCQAFSVAGLRNSLEDARGNLTLEFVRLADRLRPEWVVWENVPGVLNTPDNAFGCFLGGLVGAGEALHPAGGRWSDAGIVLGPERRVAWRVLDAQWFGVAQRRRRVFVVACPRDGADPAAVLLEFDGVRRHTPPSREPREGAATGTQRGFAAGGLGSYTESSGRGICGVAEATSAAAAKPSWPAEVAATLRCENGSPGYADQDIFSQHGANLVPAEPIAFMASDYALGMFEECDTSRPLTTSADRTRSAPLVLAAGQANAELCSDQSLTLNCNRDGAPIAFTCKDHGQDTTTDCSPTLRSMTEAASTPNGGGQVAVLTQYGDEVAGTLTAGHDSSPCADLGANSGTRWRCRVAGTVRRAPTYTARM